MTVPLDIEVRRLPERLRCDPGRVILRLFRPGDAQRIRGILQRVLQLDDAAVTRLLGEVVSGFSAKHRNLRDALDEHYQEVAEFLPPGAAPSPQQQQLIGAYFTMEYAIESAALFNPSMVPFDDHEELPQGHTRFIMSLRAVGEGHISSIVFRTGTLDARCHVHIDPNSPFAGTLKVVENPTFKKQTYRLKLIEMGAYTDAVEEALDRLDATFDMNALNAALDDLRSHHDQPAALRETADNMLSLARSNYHIRIPEEHNPSEAVIFPSSEVESHGLEDVRLVMFTDDDHSQRVYGTYTAYNGAHIVPQLLEIQQGILKVHTLSGLYARNKGMALFPRKLGGYYAMISRLDNENLFLMYSDNVRFWNEARLIQAPKFPWELLQIGNCGSPLETPAGWLLLTHGVGPMRQYCIGATLLDLQDPGRIIGQTHRPLLVPSGEERTGYVPNVVYSCGGMIHQNTLIIPYGMSDVATGFATVPLDDLLRILRK